MISSPMEIIQNVGVSLLASFSENGFYHRKLGEKEICLTRPVGRDKPTPTLPFPFSSLEYRSEKASISL